MRNKATHFIVALLGLLLHAASLAMPLLYGQDSYSKSAFGPYISCAECYEIESESVCQRRQETTPNAPTIAIQLRLPGQIHDAETGLHYNDRRYYDPDTGRYLSRDPIGFEGGINLYTYAAAAPSRFTDPTGEIIPCLVGNYARCLVTCGIQGAAMAALTGDCLDLGDLAKDCLTSCLFSMLPIPDPCGKFGKLFSIGVGLANSFEGDTPVHVRVLTDSGYIRTTKKIKDIQVGDEVLAWDEVKAYDIAQTKENLKLQASLQAKSASSRQETCAECYENSSNSPSMQQALPQSATGQQLDGSAESYQKVTDLMSSVKEQTLYHITLDNGQTLQATAGHPFKTNQGWRDAVMLKKGGKLLLKGSDEDASAAQSEERYATITQIQEEIKTIPVFNLEVAHLHTFYVGEDGVVVHNGHGSYTCTFKSGKKYHGKGDRKRAEKSGRDHARDNNDPLVDIDWTSAANDRDSFRDEHNRMKQDSPTGSPNSNRNYNQRHSPGRRY
jgi:RHS repeat-associated protein